MSQADIEKVEASWRIRFPDDYRTVVLEADEGHPDADVFYLPSGYRLLFSHLYSLNPEESMNIVMTWASYFSLLPARVFPFADDGAGNSYCFDYRATDDDPPVVVVFHDGGDEPVVAAASFAEFVDRLQHDPLLDEDDVED